MSVMAPIADHWLRGSYLHEFSDRPSASPVSAKDLVADWMRGAFLSAGDLERKLGRSRLTRAELAARLAAIPPLEYDDSGSPELPLWRDALDAAPDWAKRLDELTAAHPERARAYSSEEQQGFGRALLPLVNAAWREIETRLAPLTIHFDLESVRRDLRRDLLARLHFVCDRTLVLELNVARVQERLTGGTAEERFDSFVGELRESPDAWRRLFLEYQALGRQVVDIVSGWSAAVAELLERLERDRHAIAGELLSGAERPRLVGLRGGLSDPHRHGRGVWILTFEAGASVSIVYKPKPLGVDARFQELVAWCNRAAANGEIDVDVADEPGRFPRLRTLRIVSRDEYGWVEHIGNDACVDELAVRRFYLRLGGFLALAHLLGATDLHSENILACGEHPVLIDLETLFHPDFDLIDDGTAAARADRLLAHSAIRTGMLPQRVWGQGGNDGVNISGLGDANEQDLPYAIPDWEAAGTDQMRQIRRKGKLPRSQNLPALAGVDTSVLRHVSDLVGGYRAIYLYIMSRRDEMLGPNSPLRAFAADPVRIVFRATTDYAKIICDSRHPDNLRVAADRDRLLDVLWPMSRHAQSVLDRLIPSEQAQLRRGDVPYFWTTPGSAVVRDSDGGEIEAVFARSSLEQCFERIERMSAESLNRETGIIASSIATLARGAVAAGSGPPSASRVVASVAPSSERLIAQAMKIGEKLAADAILGDEDTTWIGTLHAGSETWRLGPLGEDLYDGTTGLALFLGALASATGRRDYEALARRAMLASWRSLDRLQGTHAPAGGFSGASSVIYTAAALSRVLNDPSLLGAYEPWLERLRVGVADDKVFDIVAGSAGALLCMLALFDVTGDEEAIDVAVTCAERLERAAVSAGTGVGWPAVEGTRPLLGFSHGAAGIAPALARLAEVLDRIGRERDLADRMRALAEQALAYERGLFDRERQNWPDLRDHSKYGMDAPPDGAFMNAWCHGAPGIALARSLMPGARNDSAIVAEIEAAVATTFAEGLGGNHSLCHGDLGNLIAIETAARALGRDEWIARSRQHLAEILCELSEIGPRCGVPLGTLTPGLMCGLAGIGYALLWLSDPGRYPNVLALRIASSARDQ